jgi:hypothetical protein
VVAVTRMAGRRAASGAARTTVSRCEGAATGRDRHLASAVSWKRPPCSRPGHSRALS